MELMADADGNATQLGNRLEQLDMFFTIVFALELLVNAYANWFTSAPALDPPREREGEERERERERERARERGGERERLDRPGSRIFQRGRERGREGGREGGRERVSE